MYCVRNVTEDLYWVGANDHRLALFENIHPIPRGVSYNAYLLLDEKSVLFDTVDWSACRQLLENVEHLLGGRGLDYLVINHMEPDHGASIEEILLRYPIYAHAPVRVSSGRPRVDRGKRGGHTVLWKARGHLCSRPHGPLAGGHGHLRYHQRGPVLSRRVRLLRSAGRQALCR